MNHPLTPDQITEENYRAIATELFYEQSAYTAVYLADIAERRYYSDDDTDYVRSALMATERLMDLSYDHTRDDLVDFLFKPRDFSRTEELFLADMISAGGLCPSLGVYENLIYQGEDENFPNTATTA